MTNIYTPATYITALNPIARRFKAAKARPRAKTFGRLTASQIF